MKWNAFCDLDVGQIIDQGQKWEAGEDEAGAKEFVLDTLDNRVFQFPEGSIAEQITDYAGTAVVTVAWGTIAANLVKLISPAIHAKPLVGLKV